MKLLFVFLLSSSSLIGQGLGEVRGTVVDLNGEILPFVRILLFSDKEDVETLVAHTETDVDGQFWIKPVEPGLYDMIMRSYASEDVTIENLEILEDHINFMGELRIHTEIISCDFGLPTPMMKETMDPFGRSITITSEDIKMR